MPYKLTEEQQDIINTAISMHTSSTGGIPATSNILKVNAVAGA